MQSSVIIFIWTFATLILISSIVIGLFFDKRKLDGTLIKLNEDTGADDDIDIE